MNLQPVERAFGLAHLDAITHEKDARIEILQRQLFGCRILRVDGEGQVGIAKVRTFQEDLALQHGFAPVTLGPRVLRAETAPLAALAALTLHA